MNLERAQFPSRRVEPVTASQLGRRSTLELSVAVSPLRSRFCTRAFQDKVPRRLALAGRRAILQLSEQSVEDLVSDHQPHRDDDVSASRARANPFALSH